MKCTNCQTDNPGGAKFCRVCGQPLAPPAASAAACRHCQAPNVPGARFCVACGQLMQPAAAPAEAAPADMFAMPAALPTAAATRRNSWLIVAAAVLLLLLLLGAATAYWTLGRDAGTQAPSAVAFDPATAPEAPVTPPAPQAAEEPEATATAVETPEAPLAAPEPEPEPAPAPASAPAAPVEKKSAAEKKKAAKVERAAERVKSHDEGNHPNNRPVPVDGTPRTVASAAPDWYAGLKAELRRCAEKDNFISRGLCGERAKFRFCGDGNHWGEVPECVKTQETTNY